MSASILAIVLAAAMLHASWHALIKAGEDRFLTYSLINVVAMVAALVVLPFLPPIHSDALPWLAGSIVLHQLYKVFLIESYRLGDLSRVFPIARGVAPLLVAGGAAVVAGERLHGMQVMGLVTIAVGVCLLAFKGRSLRGTRGLDLAFAVATGAITASYTLVDAIGARASASPIAFVCWMYVADGILFPAYALLTRRAEIPAFVRANWRQGLAAGVMSIGSYGAIVWAMSLGAIGAVAALRETSVLFVALIGAVFLGERFGRSRVIASVLVVSGAVLIAAFRAPVT
jgi:drug/metabolite transporter (DMT)-like permease